MTIQKLHNTRRGVVLEREGRFGLLPGLSIDALLAKDDLARFLASCAVGAADASSAPSDLTAPIGSQEVWAAGVTYYRSRDARMEEAETAGGGSFYGVRCLEAQRVDPAHGALRTSFVHYTSPDEVTKLIRALDEIL